MFHPKKTTPYICLPHGKGSGNVTGHSVDQIQVLKVFVVVSLTWAVGENGEQCEEKQRDTHGFYLNTEHLHTEHLNLRQHNHLPIMHTYEEVDRETVRNKVQEWERQRDRERMW